MVILRIFNFSYYCTMSNKISLKYIKSLQIKKYRQEAQSFCVEGLKSVLELSHSPFEVSLIAGTHEFFEEYGSRLPDNAEHMVLGMKDLSRVSAFKSNNSAIAVAKMLPEEEFKLKGEWVIALDEINDPGNFGTILRAADWYGIRKVVCSMQSVDLYNPKTLAASMGSFTRVRVYYKELQEFLNQQSVPVYGAFLNGKSIHEFEFGKEGILLMGSESHGIRKDLKVDERLTIPSFGNAESLNVAMATAVMLDNLSRSINTPS